MRKPFFLSLSFVWAALLFYGAVLQPPTDVTPPFPHLDKLIHFIGFGILCALLLFSRTFAHSFAPLFITSCYGLLIEIVQLSVPGREADALDLIADIAGAVFALLILPLMERSFHRSLDFLQKPRTQT